MERTGQVIANTNGQLTIAFCRPSDCEKCNGCHGGRTQTELTLKGNANIGDSVVVNMPTETVLKASALAYLLPLAGLIVGLFIGNTINGDVTALIGGLLGLSIALLAIKLADRYIKHQKQWHPQLIRIIRIEQKEDYNGTD